MKHALLALLLFAAVVAEARVVSYAPYTDRVAVATFHRRTTRHFLITELTGVTYNTAALTQVVLYDSTAEDEPRVVLETRTRVYWAALWEDERHVPAILIAYNKTNSGNNVTVLFSNDGGRNFMETALPATTYYGVTQNYVDNGGPFTRGRLTPVMIGNRDFPFIVYDAAGAVWRVAANGVATHWVSAMKNSNNALVGSNAAGTQFIVRLSSGTFDLVDFNGDRNLLYLSSSAASGWIAPDGRVYIETSSLGFANGYYDFVLPTHQLYVFSATGETTRSIPNGFAIPTHDYSGAWIIDRTSGGGPTRLTRHTHEKGFEQMWSDPTGPEVEALHAGASGKTLLLQVHRPRPQPDRIITDPALAVWRLGDPPPADYDELFLAEQTNKGFLHVDPDLVAGGEPFVFDSGVLMATAPQVIISPFNPGSGGEALQEWGVVRASLKQTLVLPGVGRAIGAYGSNWTTDVTIYNPAGVPQKVELRFAQNGSSTSAATDTADTKTITLNAKEIRLVPDILGTLFGRVGSGALFINPERGVNAASRTYTRSAKGTYGFGMNAIDIYASASPRFPVSFAGAFPGPTFRTNVTLADTAGRGSEATFLANGTGGYIGFQDVSFGVPAGGQQQINGVETQLGIPWNTGALLIRPKRGFVVASVFAVDNITNDPTYFPPDINSSITRWIPVIGHVDGAYGSQFRTDLHLYNPESATRYVYLSAMPWNTTESPNTQTIELKANEARVIRDAYATLFKKSGLARLRYTTSNPTTGIRVTSRTYTLDANGGTYGCLTPPLNGFQLAARGESLELLGVTGGATHRTNLGIVEMNLSPANNQPPGSARVEIIDERGNTIDDFTVSVPIAGGVQINDLFRTRGHGHGPASALIRVSPIRGQITTYATLTDNGTNDSIYVAPYLAAQQ